MPRWALAAICCWAGTVALQVRADPPPPQTGWSPTSPAVLEAAALGRSTLAATVLWVGLVQAYADSRVEPHQIVSTVTAIGELDPHWVEPWFFGVWMCPQGSSERAELARLGRARHPEVPWSTWLGPDTP